MTTWTARVVFFASVMLLTPTTTSKALAELPAHFPSRNITYIVPFPAGGVADILARIYTPALADALGKPIVIENRPGASTSLATNSVMRAPPDGYTIMQVDMSYAVAPNVVVAGYDPVRALTPVVQLTRSTQVLSVHPSVPVKTASDLVALAKARPGELKYGTSGIGTPPHLCAVSFINATGVKILHVPYRGAPQAFQDVVAGHLQMIFTAPSLSMQQAKLGQVRILGITGQTRSSSLPDVPTFAEAGIHMKEMDSGTWTGAMVPNGTPQGIVDKLNAATNRVLAIPAVREKLRQVDYVAVGGAPSTLADVISMQTVYWRDALKAAGVKPE